MSTAPFTLEGFTPLQRIGRGGFGEVWLARQVNVDRDVAIKIGHEPITDHTAQRRFERECVALGRLTNHPNIIDVHTVGQLPDGRPFLVLEYVSGGTLWDRLQASRIEEPDLLVVSLEITDALEVAHRAGIIHRDLKPENILLRPSGQAVLGDFGIARLHDGTNTTAQAVTASVAYAAPEVLAGEPPTPLSDLYGIGICLVAAAIRDVPFVHSTDQSIPPILNRVLSEAPPDLGSLGYSRPFAEFVARLVAKDPSLRPPNAAAVIDEVRRLQGGQADPGRSGQDPPPRPEPSSRETVVASAGPDPLVDSTPEVATPPYPATQAAEPSRPQPAVAPTPQPAAPQRPAPPPPAPAGPGPGAYPQPAVQSAYPVAPGGWTSGHVPGAWTGGPVGPVPTKPRRSGCLIVLILVSVMALVVGGCGIWLVNLVQAPLHATNDFYAALDDGRFADAYDLLCPETRPADAGTFELIVADGAASITDYNFLSSDTDSTGPADTAVVTGSVYLNGFATTTEVQLTEYDDGWKVCSYNVP
ncbi:MAG: protein kinase domain-containing protein [Acidimicrobiales bacterium]